MGSLRSSFLEIQGHIAQLLCNSDPGSVKSIEARCLVDKKSITREIFTDVVKKLYDFGRDAVELNEKQAKKLSEQHTHIKSSLKELLPEALKEAMVNKTVDNESTNTGLEASFNNKSPPKDQVTHKLMLEEQSGDKITEQKWTTVLKKVYGKNFLPVQ